MRKFLSMAVVTIMLASMLATMIAIDIAGADIEPDDVC